MRLILDLQACQTESRKRGIGRYVDSLARAILALRGSGAQSRVALDGSYPEQATRVRGRFRDLLTSGSFHSYHYPVPTMPDGDPADPRRDIASRVIARDHATFYPDAILQGSVFEGYLEPVVTCEHLTDVPGSMSAAIAYDLIPLIYPDSYLAQENARKWYFRKLQVLRNCDLLLAISDATRLDLVERLGFPSERIAVIGGAADPMFRVLPDARQTHVAALHRFGITRKYILYTGNGDFRKNVRGAIEAFARLPENLRRHYQLVLNQADRQHVLGELAAHFGLVGDEVIITGYVDDSDLVTLFNCCELFLFPSLYEGFGLPVLEAMACGAAVIGGDNSSIPELIQCREARFDASDPESVAACTQRALTDAGFRQALREQGERRAKEFSWQRSARIALEAIEEGVRRKQVQFRAGACSRRRLAMFTPLPPERSGIANYSADLLPHLARHFSIDIYTTAATSDVALSGSFRIRPWRDYEEHSHEYDGVVYQLGNSPFHIHMLDLIEKHPGIVVLHDFFLSSAFWYMDRYGGRQGAFREELAYCHDAEALDVLDGPDGESVCRQRYPCNRRVLERSLGVIAHSPSIHDLLALYGMENLAKPVRVARQLRSLPTTVSETDRNEIRARLGYSPSDWLVCSFGFIADTKLSDHLVHALVQSGLSRAERVHLILVGEFDRDEYRDYLRPIIAGSGMGERVHITGFVDDKDYLDYLSIADVAVQLRTLSRGETSRAVLDCLAHGVPLIANAHGTMNDYPASILLRVSEQAEPGELASALTHLYEHADARKSLGRMGRNYIAREHSPSRIAADYAAAIEEMIQRDAYLDVSSLAKDVARTLFRRPDASELIESVSVALSRNAAPNPSPSLFVDLSEIVKTDYGTGIQRVVRNLTRELIGLNASAGYQCVPTFLDGPLYRIAAGYARERLGVRVCAPEQDNVVFASGDVLLLLDSAWTEPERFLPVLQAAEHRGVEIVGYVYDLIPIRHADTCWDGMPGPFRHWLEHTVRTSHAIVCISRATADDLIAFITENGLEHRSGLRIHYAHLGSDLDGANLEDPTSEIITVFGDSRPTFLMVGTLEPRKGHVEVLDAFEQLWSNGCDLGLCLIGKPGWKMEDFVERLLSHSEFKKRLHWLERPNDADLDFAYRHASALIQASHAEGFGLPLLEAARCGTPIVCSDIPVFREIVGDNATFFEPRATEALARVLRRFVESGEPSLRTPGCVRTWRDAAEDVVRVLGANPAYHIFA